MTLIPNAPKNILCFMSCRLPLQGNYPMTCLCEGDTVRILPTSYTQGRDDLASIFNYGPVKTLQYCLIYHASSVNSIVINDWLLRCLACIPSITLPQTLYLLKIHSVGAFPA